MTITILNTNQAPILAPLPIQSTREDMLLEIPLAAGDIDSNALVFALTNLPAETKFDVQTRILSWTPTYTQAGEYTVTVRVTDPSGAFDKMDVRLFVDDLNRAPTLTVD